MSNSPNAGARNVRATAVFPLPSLEIRTTSTTSAATTSAAASHVRTERTRPSGSPMAFASPRADVGRLRQIERRVVAQDLGLQLAQRRTGLEGQLLDQHRAAGTVGPRAHPLGDRSGRAQAPAAHATVPAAGTPRPAPRAQGTLRRDGRARAPPRSAPQARAAAAPRAAAPPTLRTARTPDPPADALATTPRLRQHLRRLPGIAVLERSPALSKPLLERLQVELSLLDAQQLAGRASEQPRLLTVIRQRFAQTRDLYVQQRSAESPADRRAAHRPDRSRDTTWLALHNSSASSARCLGPPTVRHAVAADLERPEDREFHTSAHRHYPECPPKPSRPPAISGLLGRLRGS